MDLDGLLVERSQPIIEGSRRRIEEKRTVWQRENAQLCLKELRPLQQLYESVQGSLVFISWEHGARQKVDLVALDATVVRPCMAWSHFCSMAEFEPVRRANPTITPTLPYLQLSGKKLDGRTNPGSSVKVYVHGANADDWACVDDKTTVLMTMSPLRVSVRSAVADCVASWPMELVDLAVSYLSIPSELITDQTRWLEHYLAVTCTTRYKNVIDHDVSDERDTKRSRIQ